MSSRKTAIAFASLSVIFIPAKWIQANVSVADSVVEFTPGDSAPQTYWGASYAGPSNSWTSGPGLGLPNPTINLADDEDNGIFGDNSTVTPFNPQYNPSKVVGLGGTGGYIQMHLSEPVSTNGFTLGVHAGVGLNDISYPSGTNGSFGPDGSTPVAEDFTNDRTAVVLVSADGNNWVTLNQGNPITFAMPTNVFTDLADPYFSSPDSKWADFEKPFLVNGSAATLSAFDGKDWTGTQAVLNGSAGGTWLDLSGTGLSIVNYVAFETTGDESMLIDSVVGIGPTTLVWTANGSSGIWDTGTQNWNNGTGAAPFHPGDAVTFNDNNGNAYSVTLSNAIQPSSVIFNASGNYILSGTGSIADQPFGPATTLTQLGAGSLTISTANTFTGATTIGSGIDTPTFTLTETGRIASTNVTVNKGATAHINGLLTGTPDVTVLGNITLGISTAANNPTGGILVRNWNSLTIGSAASVSLDRATNISQHTVLVTAGLTFTDPAHGTLNLSNNDLLIHNGSPDAIFTELKTGRGAAGSYWNGPDGIVSDAAAQDTRLLTTLGYRTGGNPFDGMNTATTDVLVKYTYYGDADLSGTVNGADYQQIDHGFGAHLTGWSNGDFNYDGVVNGTDYSLIDNAFNQLTATAASPLAISTATIAGSGELSRTVPEPGTVALIGFLAAGLLSQRGRKKS